jgi:hypothetical protein
MHRVDDRCMHEGEQACHYKRYLPNLAFVPALHRLTVVGRRDHRSPGMIGLGPRSTQPVVCVPVGPESLPAPCIRDLDPLRAAPIVPYFQGRGKDSIYPFGAGGRCRCEPSGAFPPSRLRASEQLPDF